MDSSHLTSPPRPRLLFWECPIFKAEMSKRMYGGTNGGFVVQEAECQTDLVATLRVLQRCFSACSPWIQRLVHNLIPHHILTINLAVRSVD